MTLPQSEVRASRLEDGTLLVDLSGNWKLAAGLPSPDLIEREIAGELTPRRLAFDASGVAEWDTGLLAFLQAIHDLARKNKIPVDFGGLPEGLRNLITLATAVEEREGARRAEEDVPVIDQIGTTGLDYYGSAIQFLEFLGENVLVFGKFLAGKARFRKKDFAVLLQDAGVGALLIVTVINFLIGAILAFVGAVELQTFGAGIFVADLVAVGMTREMASLMTAIILSGRTGASYAASLGTMKVNEEIDALNTMGIDPMEFLVLPRIMALALMTPLLCVYADFIGMLGGMSVGTFVLDLGAREYLEQTRSALNLQHLFVGLIKGGVYGILIALAGCFQGIRSGRSASAVGDAATAAAVTGIVAIIVADLAFNIIFTAIGI